MLIFYNNIKRIHNMLYLKSNLQFSDFSEGICFPISAEFIYFYFLLKGLINEKLSLLSSSPVCF